MSISDGNFSCAKDISKSIESNIHSAPTLTFLDSFLARILVVPGMCAAEIPSILWESKNF